MLKAAAQEWTFEQNDFVVGRHGTGVEPRMISIASFKDWAYRQERGENKYLCNLITLSLSLCICWRKVRAGQSLRKICKLTELHTEGTAKIRYTQKTQQKYLTTKLQTGTQSSSPFSLEKQGQTQTRSKHTHVLRDRVCMIMQGWKRIKMEHSWDKVICLFVLFWWHKLQLRNAIPESG